MVRDWLGIAEGLVSILRDWSKMGEAFVWVFREWAWDWSESTYPFYNIKREKEANMRQNRCLGDTGALVGMF